MVGEISFTKVKQRQLNKFNNLLNKKEGNITNSPSNFNFPSRQAGRYSPSPQGRKQLSGTSHWVRHAGRHSSSLWGRRQFISGRQPGFPGIPGNYFLAKCSPSPWGRKQLSSTGHSVKQAGRHSPSLWGRKQLGGRHSPSPGGRKQSSSISGFPDRCSPSLQGR